LHQYKIQTIKYRLDLAGLRHGLQTSNLEPTKYNLVYQAIPEKLIKVDKLQTTFKGAEGSKIYSARRKAIPDVYNSLSEKCRPYSGVATLLNNL